MESETNTLLRKAHIENRGLYKLASGQIRLRDWEQDHLHTCEVCQGVLYVLLNQLAGAANRPNEKLADNAA